jgi:outer membrane receptor protein involved in Fe transport
MSVVALLIATTIAVSMSALAQPRPTAEAPAPPPAKDTANYIIRVQWKGDKGVTGQLQVLTSEGNFSLNTLLPEPVKINGMDIPQTVTLKGDLHVLSNDKGRINLFLGRTVPYVTSTYGGSDNKNTSSSYQQLQVGLGSTFTVTFGKPLVIQSDGKEEVTILVKRDEN